MTSGGRAGQPSCCVGDGARRGPSPLGAKEGEEEREERDDRAASVVVALERERGGRGGQFFGGGKGCIDREKKAHVHCTPIGREGGRSVGEDAKDKRGGGDNREGKKREGRVAHTHTEKKALCVSMCVLCCVGAGTARLLAPAAREGPEERNQGGREMGCGAAHDARGGGKRRSRAGKGGPLCCYERYARSRWLC